MTVHIFINKYEEVILAKTKYKHTVSEAREIAHQETDMNLHYEGTVDDIEAGEAMKL